MGLKKGQCFDKLSMDGLGMSFENSAYPELVEGLSFFCAGC